MHHASVALEAADQVPACSEDQSLSGAACELPKPASQLALLCFQKRHRGKRHSSVQSFRHTPCRLCALAAADTQLLCAHHVAHVALRASQQCPRQIHESTHERTDKELTLGNISNTQHVVHVKFAMERVVRVCSKTQQTLQACRSSQQQAGREKTPA